MGIYIQYIVTRQGGITAAAIGDVAFYMMFAHHHSTTLQQSWRSLRSVRALILNVVCVITVCLATIGSFSSFMAKEIHEQPESVMNTMRGRVNFDSNLVVLGGLKDYMTEIRRCRRLLFIACSTSYHSTVAVILPLLLCVKIVCNYGLFLRL